MVQHQDKEGNKQQLAYIPLPVYLIATEKEGKPAIEIRKLVTDENYIKLILTAAFAEIPLQVQPVFTNKLQSISTLIKKGILYFNKDKNVYEFTF